MTPASKTPVRYRVFLSYSHSDNRDLGRQWANWLKHEIENYRVPPHIVERHAKVGDPIPERLAPVFRDEDCMGAGAQLGKQIFHALQRSEWLICLCSPRSAQSWWVNAELRDFKRMGKCDRILGLVIEGHPKAREGDGKGAGVRPTEECLPPRLRRGRPHPIRSRPDGTPAVDWSTRIEPNWADVRLPKTRAQGYTSAGTYSDALKTDGRTPEHQIATLAEAYEQQLRRAVLKLIAGILGEEPEELEQCDDQLRRQEAEAYAEAQVRAKVRARRIALGVSVLAAAACGAGGFAFHQRRQALAEKVKAESAAAEARKSRDEASAWGDMAFVTLVARLPNVLQAEEYGTLNALVAQLGKLKQNAPPKAIMRLNLVFEAVRHQYLAAQSEAAGKFDLAAAHHDQRLKNLINLTESEFGDSEIIEKQIASALFSLAGSASRLGDFGRATAALKRAVETELHIQSIEISDLSRRFTFSRMSQNVAMRMYAAHEMKYAADAFEVESSLLKSAYSNGDGSLDGRVRLARAIENRGRCVLALGKRSEALLLQRESLAMLEDALKHVEEGSADTSTKALVLNRIAWSVATTPHEQLGDAGRALTLATEACQLTRNSNPDYLDTLAATHAASGDFAAAAKIQADAIARYRELSPTREAPQIADEHQKSYLTHSVWQQIAPEGAF